jgi:RHS repeat-associated protein
MRRHFALTLTGGLFLRLSSLSAQTATPNENPEGDTGALKSQITTGGSYDGHSGNGTRIVTDLHLPGALGAHGLDFTRYWNSTPNDHDNQFAVAPTNFGPCGWSHSWEWHAEEEETDEKIDPKDDNSEEIWTIAITITFPDGHANRYKITRSNMWHGTAPPDGRPGPPYTVPEQNGFVTSGAIYDKLADMAADGSQFWLFQADGSAVHFTGGPGSYQATQVFDPHGLRTDLHYNTNGDLDQVTQEGGRWLTITWGYKLGWWHEVITRVDSGGSAGTQSVLYDYGNILHVQTGSQVLALTTVTYPNDSAPGQDATATYSYEDYNGDPYRTFYFTGPRLVVADDPHFAGPMRTIRYAYRDSQCVHFEHPQSDPPEARADYFYALGNSLAAEKSGDHLDPVSGQPVLVSGFSLGCWTGTRVETSGLGGWRTFNYGHSAGYQGSGEHLGYQLIKLTDFTTVNPPPGNLPFERQNWLQGQAHQIWDGRGTETDAIVTPNDSSGQLGEIHHVTADGTYQIFDRVNPGASATQDYTLVPNRFNHWLFSHRDERGLTTTYRRDSRRRVTDITYFGGSAEHFEYNEWNQVTSHTLPSGAIETYVYDPSTHRLTTEYNSVDGPDARKDYTYDSLERVATVSDGRSRAAGRDFSTRMTYNGRHKVLTVEYAGMFNAANPTVTYEYDAYGNCRFITDELGHRSEYQYDSYRRCTRYIEPLHALDWKGTDTVASRTWEWVYDRDIPETGLRDSYTHTKNEWRVQIEPAFNAAGERKMTERGHDLQNRIIRQESGWIQRPTYIGDWYWSGDGEIHEYTYNENGQKKTDTLYIAPSNRVTIYTYDLRNRLKDTIETKRADQTVNPTTTIEYDPTGNKTLVTFPDTRTQQWLNYDAFGQAWSFIDERRNTTNLSFIWGPMKKLFTVTTHRAKDGGGTEDQQTVSSYDPMGRPQTTLFPDGSNEYRTYECTDSVSYNCDQVHTWRTRKGQIKTIVYDARGREISNSWANDAAPGISRSWDDANRLSSITNIFSSIDFAYDDAGQVIWEGDEIAGSGGRTQTNYYRYPDGSVAHLHYPGGAYVRHDYTARGQLAATGWDDDENNWWMQLVHYNYLPDGKVWSQDYGNGVRSAFDHDERGMIRIVDHYRSNVSPTQDLSWRQYWRDNRDRITAFQKSYNPGANPMENGRGDRFAYDDEGQVTDAWYNALDPAGNASSWTRKDHFSYDALGNRQGVNNNLASRNAGLNAISFVRRDNGLNQYTHWWPAGLDYPIYHDDNSPFPGYNSFPGNGVLMTDGWLVASYNALNQPVAMVPYGWANAVYFGYDPLGRCVKRWVGDSGDVYSNPATYFHYDGWNLLQEGSNAWGPARVYVHGNRVDEIVWSYNTFTGEEAFHQYDARGHCTLLTDRSGNVLEQYEYDAFGQPYFYDASGNSIGAVDAQGLWAGYSLFGNRFLFTGREWLSDLKVYDFRNRMYQPELGRFLQPDPKEFAAGDYNLYRYCHNDPVNRNDAFGLRPPELDYGADKASDAAEHLKQLRQIPELAEKFKKIDGTPIRNLFKDAQGDKNPARAGKNGLKPNFTDDDNRHPFTRFLNWLLGRPRTVTSYYDPHNSVTGTGQIRPPIFGMANELGEMYEVNNHTAGVGGPVQHDNRTIEVENSVRRWFGATERPYKEGNDPYDHQ